MQSPQPLPQEGQAFAETELERLGKRLEGNECSATDDWRAGEILYYTPVILLHHRAYAGPSQRFVCLGRIADLYYQNLGSVLRLRWTWPDDCHEALITYGAQPCEHDDPSATTRLLSRIDYDSRDCYEIRDFAGQDCHIVISAAMKRGEELVIGRAVRTAVRLASRAVITYEIKKTSLLPGRLTLRLTVDAPELPTTLPALTLIAKQGGVPLRRTDGKPLLHIKSREVGERRLEIDLPAARLAPATFGKLYLEDDTLYGAWVIHHPAIERMRLR